MATKPAKKVVPAKAKAIRAPRKRTAATSIEQASAAHAARQAAWEVESDLYFATLQPRKPWYARAWALLSSWCTSRNK